ncbi:MAG: bifunctional UDP-N-acetylglucosamine diphosphorylase/glucosamine-1-phosphate N-acetyltransferase GlmU [Pseudomonadota bacterium]
MQLEVIILAAGQGTRMKSSLPKVLHPLAGRALLEHVLWAAQSLEPREIHVVIGHGSELVQQQLSSYSVNWVIQQEQLGTGHGVLQALPSVSADSTVLVLYGDVPLIRTETLRSLTSLAECGPALISAQVADPEGYGRILRDENGALRGVVEHKDATEEQRTISEVNTGLLAAPAADLFEYLPQVRNDNQQGEYYLPDILSLSVAAGKPVANVLVESELEVLGVNDRQQLNVLEREYQRLQAEHLMRAGVTLADASRLDIRGNLSCATDVSIDVNVVIEGEVSLAAGAIIGANCVLRDVRIGTGTIVHPMSHLEGVVVGDNCHVGPYARLRPGTVLAEGAKIGNFVETKKTQVGAGSKINHLSYVGDSKLGERVNVGAGTITCNYDGVNKHETNLGDGVFVGSNSTLVAPLSVEAQGFVAAGSTVTKDVKEDELAVGRGRQRNISGWQRPGKQGED